MAVDVASLALRVDALEVNQASEAMKRLQKSGSDAESGLKSSTAGIVAGFQKVAGQAAILVAAFQTISGVSRNFVEFDKSIALISTQLGDATEQTKEFESASKSLALQFGTKLTDQSAAFYEVLSAGITDTKQATDLLVEANKLAIGGNAQLATTIDGLTSIMKGYGDKVKDVSDVSDGFFTAALAGKTTIEELAEGLGRVVPIAETLNVTFDELSGSVAALTLSGISTREAITGVRGILAAVVKPSAEAAEEAKRLGLAFDANAVKAKGFAAFLEDIKQKTGGSTASMALLFGGVESLLPALALTGNAGIEFNKIMEQMANKTGIAQESFEKMNNSDSAKIDRLFAAVNSISITLGGTLSSILTPAAEGAASALNKLFGSVALSGVQKQEKLIDSLQSKLERMKGINAVFPVDNLIFNKKDFAELEFQLETAKQDLKDLLEVKQEIVKPGKKPNAGLTPNDPPTGKDSKSGKKEAISESQRFLETLQNEAREAGVTGIALLQLKSEYLGVADSAAPFIKKMRESEAALTAQKDTAAQYARDLDKVKNITNEVATAEDIFIAKQNELNRLLSTGLLDPGTYFKALEKAGDDLSKTTQTGAQDFKQLEFAVQGWGRNAADALVEFATSGKASFSDFATSVLKDILRMSIQMQLITPLFQSLQSFFPGGSGGGAAASTNAASSVFSNLFKGGRANGGGVSPNSMYQVNERGIPEMLLSGGKQFLLTANQSGNVVPLKSSAGSGGGVIVNLIESPGKGGTTKQSQTASGGIQLDIMVDQLVAKKQAEQGSATNKSLRNNYGLSNQLVMR
jgi:TP901 family phage tail tape measure protein